MIQLATDAVFLNRVLNDPEVYPHIHAKPGPIDLSVLVSDQRNVVLNGEHGSMIFSENAPGVLEIHTQVLPDGRGPWAKLFAEKCVDYVFCRTRANEVFTRVPEGNIAAAALAKVCGAKLEHRVKQAMPDGTEPMVDLYSGRVQDWVRIANGLVERGQMFHEKLHKKCRDAGIKVNHHPDDDWHDRHVGAAVGMILGGQVMKGIVMFNRWATMAMAPPIRLVAESPVIINITDCLLVVIGDDFEVTPCPRA